MSSAESIPVKQFSERQLAALSAQLDGDVVHPRHPDYDRARRIWDWTIDRHPAVLVRCQTDADVATAIAFARDHAVPLTVKGGGHSVAWHSMVDDGFVIDLGGMRQVTVTPEAGRVRVGGGCLLTDMDCATQAFGLATPGRQVRTTGHDQSQVRPGQNLQ
jgi:FAD/FMN-containing dehydrogenase